jgi:hypothetical protein
MEICRIVRLTCFAVAALSLAHAQVNPQTARTIIRPPLRPLTKVDPKIYRVNQKAAIPFKPLDMVDPRTGKPIAPGAPITLPPTKQFPNGKTLTAAQFYEQMNKAEAELNKLGYSVRDQQKKNVLYEMNIDKDAVRRQVLNLRTTPRNAATAATLDRMVAAHRNYIDQAKNGPVAAGGASKMLAIMPGLHFDNRLALMPALANLVLPKAPPQVRGDIRVSTFWLGPDNQPQLSPEIQIQTANDYVGVILLNGAPPMKKYAWQLVEATPKSDNFGGNFVPRGYDDNGPFGWKTWPTAVGLVASGTSPVMQEPGQTYFLIDMKKAVSVPAGTTIKYFVRAVPVNDDGSMAGYPSNALPILYGTNPYVPPVQLPPAPPIPVFAPATINQPWSYPIGDKSVLAVDLEENLSETRTANSANANVSFSAGAFILGNEVKFLEIAGHANFVLPTGANTWNETSPGSADGGISVKLAGVEVCDKCSTAAPGFSGIDQEFGQPFDIGIPVSFPIGPIDINGQVGFQGNIGVEVAFGFGISDYRHPPTNPIHFQAGPYVQAGAYIEVGVGVGLFGIDVADAGVEGSVTALDLGLTFGLEGGHYYGALSRLRVLEGSLTVFAKIGLCPFVCSEQDFTFFTYPGIDVLGGDPNKGHLFDGTL